MYCRACGKEIPEDSNFCPHCGSSQIKIVTNNIRIHSESESDKNRLVACLLAFFLGGLGVHRFYAGKIGTGIFQILLTCCFGIGYIWALIDFIMIVCGKFQDNEGKVIYNWDIN
ncbi:MAG: TM2 domain-containing protein [Spirochaetia bacterium]|nr:TM2 domain-containing protein [Spirochaetia bacterium]